MKARHALEYAGARILLAFFRLLPLRLGCAVGAWLGSVVCALDRRHRNLGLWNLSRSTADRGPRGNRRVVRGLYRHLGMMLAETANQSRLDVGAIGRMIVVEGDEHLRRALARGKGAIIVVAHFGNWELSGAACALAGHRVKVVAFPQRNPLTDRLIVAIREASGMEVLQTGAAARPILRALKEGCVVGILADQDVAERGVFVRLLGREASTAKGPVVLAHRTGAPLLTAFLHREGAGRHRLVYQPELPLTGDASADTQAWTDRLSREVETRPDHWLWLHDRWKSQRRDDGTIVRVRNPPPGWRP